MMGWVSEMSTLYMGYLPITHALLVLPNSEKKKKIVEGHDNVFISILLCCIVFWFWCLGGSL